MTPVENATNLHGQESFLTPTGETTLKGKTLSSGIVEFYITPFALLDYDPEDSLVS